MTRGKVLPSPGAGARLCSCTLQTSHPSAHSDSMECVCRVGTGSQRTQAVKGAPVLLRNLPLMRGTFPWCPWSPMQQIFLHLWPGTHCHCRSLGETVEEQEGLTHTHSPRLALMEIGGPWAATRPLAFPGPVPGCQALSSASQTLAFPSLPLTLLLAAFAGLCWALLRILQAKHPWFHQCRCFQSDADLDELQLVKFHKMRRTPVGIPSDAPLFVENLHFRYCNLSVHQMF